MRSVTRAVKIGHLLLGGLSFVVIVYWATISLPTIASSPPTGFSSTTDRPVVGRPTINDRGKVETLVGCSDGTDSASLDRFFAEQQGPLAGWDNPHVTDLGNGRSLWLMHDAYLNYDGTAQVLGDQIQNMAMIQRGSCFTSQHLGTPTDRVNFELGDGTIAEGNFLWPLGSETDGDRLWVFWGETANADETAPLGEGITRYPVATWLASYDLQTLERLSFQPAPNPGVDPVYGFAVASDEEFSYLFANTNHLNFVRQGGYANGPHSATRMFLARLPKGQLYQQPTYWDGTDWSRSAADARPISERFYAENTMQPRYLHGQWISVVQRDGFFGVDVWLEVARDPWGPWIAHEVIAYEPHPSEVEKNSYQPIILPSSSPENGVQIAISENAVVWHRAKADPTNYRPGVFEMDWPDDPDAVIEAALARLSDGPVNAG